MFVQLDPIVKASRTAAMVLSLFIVLMAFLISLVAALLAVESAWRGSAALLSIKSFMASL